MQKISIAHRQPRDWSDRIAYWMVSSLRWGTDVATGYKHDKDVLSGAKDPHAQSAHGKYAMNERKWLIRFVFLESVAGVPGMVAGMLRHLHSLRRMKRDNGWCVPQRLSGTCRRKLNRCTGSRHSSRKPTTSACTF